MEDLEQLKKLINDKAFSRRSTRVLNKILDKAIERGYLYEDEKKTMQIIMDYEIEVQKIQGQYLTKQTALWMSYYENVIKKVETLFSNVLSDKK